MFITDGNEVTENDGWLEDPDEIGPDCFNFVEQTQKMLLHYKKLSNDPLGEVLMK